ncbi:transcriptional regulator [Eisenbergiella tayi]|uniref:Transcriptional regulator n=1 Tax=Eisenbergiella tayi TaxID=1432052 RepID=A0A1E3UMG0_9FIRM|nr:autorepressor SdpR family transcription factor [Eisenbergiella tayi]ODR54195.1 transcriptional regulator [Eisenbergiella tayi]
MSFPDVFKALSDPVRREILTLLKQQGKMPAGEIAAEFELSNATISYHLSMLRKADLVFETRYQKYIYYEINTSVFESIAMWILQFRE